VDEYRSRLEDSRRHSPYDSEREAIDREIADADQLDIEDCCFLGPRRRDEWQPLYEFALGNGSSDLGQIIKAYDAEKQGKGL
jgi:hypothetical protein